MNIYKITQKVNTNYDTYRGAVVVAESMETAKKTHPNPRVTHYRDGRWYSTYADDALHNAGEEYENGNDTWANPSDVCVECIGRTKLAPGVILSDFMAG